MALAYPAAALISPAQAFSTAKGLFRLGLWITLLDLALNIVFLGVGATQGPAVLGAMFSLRAAIAAGFILYLVLRADEELRWPAIRKALRPIWITCLVIPPIWAIRDLANYSGLWGVIALGAGALVVYAALVMLLCRNALVDTLSAFPIPAPLRRIANRLLRADHSD